MSDHERKLFSKKDDASPSSFDLLGRWWEALQHDKGERAKLRRASTLTEVMICPAYMRLLQSLREQGYKIGNYETTLAKVATVAGLAARIKGQTAEELNGLDGLATRMGVPKGEKTPVVSELCVRRILACDEIEELYTLLRRALAMLGDKANLNDLATTVWRWSPLDEKRPYDPRRDMAYDYYSNFPQKP